MNISNVGRALRPPFFSALQVLSSSSIFIVAGVIIRTVSPRFSIGFLGTGCGIIVGRLASKAIRAVDAKANEKILMRVIAGHRLYDGAKAISFIGASVLGIIAPPLGWTASMALGVYHGLWLEALNQQTFRVLRPPLF